MTKTPAFDRLTTSKNGLHSCFLGIAFAVLVQEAEPLARWPTDYDIGFGNHRYGVIKDVDYVTWDTAVPEVCLVRFRR